MEALILELPTEELLMMAVRGSPSVSPVCASDEPLVVVLLRLCMFAGDQSKLTMKENSMMLTHQQEDISNQERGTRLRLTT